MVAYLASDAAAHITGQVFGVTGGLVQLYQGWTPVAELSKDARWEPAELAGQMAELFGERPRPTCPELGAPPAPRASAGGLGTGDTGDGDLLRRRPAVRRARSVRTRRGAGPRTA